MPKRILTFLIAAVLVMTEVIPVWNFLDADIAQAANNLYVATTGADSSNCQTEGSPCLTINYAIGQAATGDTIYVAAGTYDELVSCDGKSVNFIGADRDTTIIAPSSTGTAVYLKPAADNDMEFKNFKVVPSSNSYTGIQMYEQTSGSYVTMTVDNVWVDQALIGVLISSGAWNTLYSVTNSLITRPKRQGINNAEMGGGNRTIDTVDNVFIWADGTQDSGYYCIDNINTVTNSMCTGTYGGVRFDIDGNVGEEDPYFANNYIINVPYTSFLIGNFSNDDKKCGAIINNTSIGKLDYGANIDCYSSATGDKVGLVYNNFFMDGRYGVTCSGPVTHSDNAFHWTWWESGDKDGFEGSCNTSGDLDTNDIYHTQAGGTSAWPAWEFETDAEGTDLTWTIASHTAYTVTVTPDPGWTNDEWVGRWMSHQDVWSYMPYYIIDNTSDTITVAADDQQSFTTMTLNSVLAMDDGDWIKIFDSSFPQIGMTSNLIDTGMDPVDILTAGEYTAVKDSYNGQARPYDAKALGASYTQWDRGASERYYEKSVYDQPTISAPTATGYNTTSVSMTTSTAAGEDYASHSSSDWRLCSDEGCNTVVWSADNDTTNLTSNELTGTGALSGLSSYTQYYVSVRYDNEAGASAWSNPYSFWTEYTGASDTTTWHFNEATPTSTYSYSGTVMEVNAGSNSYVQLIDLGGGTYTATGIDGTSKKVPVTISNSGGELTNYQVRLAVTYDSDMQADFDDLRFTDTDGSTEIDYWTESYTASTSAAVWVEIPTIAASADTTIFMYYGNDTISSESDVSNTFVFGDDFSGASLDASWTEVTSGGASAGTFSGGQWTKTCDGECDWWSTTDLDAGIYIEDPGSTWEAITYMTSATASSNRHEGIMLYQAVRDGFLWGLYAGNEYQAEQTGATRCDTATSTVPVWFKIANTTGNGTGADDTYTFWSSTNGSTWTQCDSYSATDTMNNVGLFIKDWTSGETSATFDHFILKKYAATEPTSAFGSESSVTSYDTVSIAPQSGQNFTEILSISNTLGATNAGTIAYQVSVDGSAWYYHTGTGAGWSAVSNDITDNNTITEVNTYLPAITTEVGTGAFYFKAFLISTGSQKTEIDSVTLGYDGGAPTGLADFAFDSSTATTATLTWTAATDGAFDHYEIWYGTDQSDVQNRAASEWDNDDDSDLATATTATTTITGLSAGVDYYAKIWAVDGFGNEATIDDISFNTNQSPTVTPSSTTAAETTNGTKYVTISFEADDGDDDTLSAKVEYSVGAGWNKATLLESVSGTYGTPAVNNLNAYQISSITTSSGANTITTTWDSATDLGTTDTSTAQVRVTPYDSIADGTAIASSNFILDQVAPSGGFIETYTTSIDETSVAIGWDPITTETNFAQYTVYYKRTSTDTYSSAGTLTTMSTSSSSITGLTAGVQYDVYVQAADDYGNTTNSPVLTFTTSQEGEGTTSSNTASQAGGGSGSSGGDGGASQSETGDSDQQAGEGETGDEDYSGDITTPTDEIPEQPVGEEEASEEDYSGDIEEEVVETPVEEVVETPIEEAEPEDYISEPLHESPEEEGEEETQEEPISVGVFDEGEISQEVYEDEIVITLTETEETITVEITEEIIEKAIEVTNEEVVEKLTETTKDFSKEASKVIEEILDDKDADGIPDKWEEKNLKDEDFDGTADTDGDGLTDLEEYQAGSDPLDADTDNDGLTDIVEISLGLDPDSWDSDNDGFSDTEEIFNNQDPTERDTKEIDTVLYDEQNDTDGDGLSDYMEKYYNTDPYSADTDGDGISDTEELEYDLNPNEVDYIEEVETKITNIKDTTTSTSDIVIKGTTTPNTTAYIYILNKEGEVKSVIETETDENGKFIATNEEDLPDGDYEMFVATDEEMSSLSTINVDSTQEKKELDIEKLNDQEIQETIETEESKPKVEGKTEPGTIIYATWKSIILTSVVVADSQTGEFVAEAPSELEEGEHTAYLYTIDEDTGIQGEATQVNFTITGTNVLHESAAQREADEKGFPYMTLILFALIAMGASFVLLKRNKSQQQEERELIKKL